MRIKSEPFCYGDESLEDCVDRVIADTKNEDVRELAKLYRWHRRYEFLPMKKKHDDTHAMVAAILEREESNQRSNAERAEESRKFRERIDHALFDEEHGLIKLGRDSHKALFDIESGFVPLRMWWCKTLRQAGAVGSGISVLVGVIFSLGKISGWW